MATVSVHVDASKGRVLALLKRAEAYPRWVIGTRRVVAVDPAWPSPGTSFTHEFGIGPLVGHDRTELLSLDEERGEITLEARARPAGRARVHLHVVPCEDGTLVTLDEQPASGPLALIPGVLMEPLTWVRNRRSLARLQRMAEQPRG